MKTRIYKWFNTTTRKPEFGIQVFHDGIWMHSYENHKPRIYQSEAEANEKRKEIRPTTKPERGNKP